MVAKRYMGARAARAAERRAKRHGWVYYLDTQANGLSGMYARTDCVVLRPRTLAEMVDRAQADLLEAHMRPAARAHRVEICPCGAELVFFGPAGPSVGQRKHIRAAHERVCAAYHAHRDVRRNASVLAAAQAALRRGRVPA